MRTLGKRVRVNSPSRVRIPLSPPLSLIWDHAQTCFKNFQFIHQFAYVLVREYKYRALVFLREVLISENYEEYSNHANVFNIINNWVCKSSDG